MLHYVELMYSSNIQQLNVNFLNIVNCTKFKNYHILSKVPRSGEEEKEKNEYICFHYVKTKCIGECKVSNDNKESN